MQVWLRQADLPSLRIIGQETGIARTAHGMIEGAIRLFGTWCRSETEEQLLTEDRAARLPRHGVDDRARDRELDDQPGDQASPCGEPCIRDARTDLGQDRIVSDRLDHSEIAQKIQNTDDVLIIEIQYLSYLVAPHASAGARTIAAPIS